MEKVMRFFLVLLFFCQIFTFAQGLSKKDIVFLVKIGIPEGEIIAHIKAGKAFFQLSPKEIENLKKQGVSQAVLKAMQKHSKLTVKEIVSLSKTRTEKEVIQIIESASSLPKYKIGDWLELRRSGISIKIIQALKSKNEKSISTKDILKWHTEGVSAKEMLKRLDGKKFNSSSLNTDNLLKLKKKGVPLEVVSYLAEKHLNSYSEKTKKAPTKKALKEKPLQTKTKLPEPKKQEKPDSIIPIYPGSKNLTPPTFFQNTSGVSSRRSFDCSFFTCPSNADQIREFYRSYYPRSSILALDMLSVFRMVRLKFFVKEIKSQIEVIHYSFVDNPNPKVLKNQLQVLKAKINSKERPLVEIKEKIAKLKQKFEAKKINREYLETRTKSLLAKYNMSLSAKSYWDLVSLGQLVASKKNILLIVQPHRRQKQTQKLVLEGESRLAKDFPKLIYPQSTLVEHVKIEEGLKRTSRMRSIYHTTFICPATSDKFESFYRSSYSNLAALRLSAFDTFRIIKLKFSVPELNSRLEVALYSLSIGSKSKAWNKKKRFIKKRLSRLERPLKAIDNEIKILGKLFKEGKLTEDSLYFRTQKLKQRRSSITNTPSYKDIAAMNKALTIQQNILLLTQVKKMGK